MSDFSKNYTFNKNAPLFSMEDDDIDDDTFLSSGRRNVKSNNPLQQLTANREIIESNMIASSQRSLAIIRETEQVGVQTAQELAQQREQLERTSRNLDTINATLRTSQKNIEGIRSVFSSLKNYFSDSKDNKVLPKIEKADSASSQTTVHQGDYQHQHSQQQQYTQKSLGFDRPRPKNAQEAIDQNLDQIASNVSVLKSLAHNLGNEILEQNELIDQVQDKAEKAEFTMNKQTNQINRLLGRSDKKTT